VGAPVVKAHVTAALEAARRAAVTPPAAAVVDDVIARLDAGGRRGLAGVLNGTGILLHTNLGRAPLAPEALAAIVETAGGPSNLEYDLDAGTRGSRHQRLSALLRAATGAEDALVVNNCAAAVLLVLDTFARGALREIHRRGLRVPEDLTVTGFDGVPEAERAGLTTVRQPVLDKGRAAGRLLFDRSNSGPRTVMLPTELVVRSTCGPVKESGSPWFSGV